MDIVLREARDWRLPSGAVQKFPAGWSGTAPDAAAAQWIAEGVATRVPGAPTVVGALTPRQTAILAKAADEIDAVRETALATGQDGTADGVVDLDALTDDQLRQIATDLGIKPGRKARDKLIVAIQQAAHALEAEAAAAVPSDEAV